MERCTSFICAGLVHLCLRNVLISAHGKHGTRRMFGWSHVSPLSYLANSNLNLNLNLSPKPYRFSFFKCVPFRLSSLPSLARQTHPPQCVLLSMLMTLARVMESGLRQVEGHEWVGFSVPTTIFSTLAGTLFNAVLAPLFIELWLTLVANQSYGNGYAKTQAHFKVVKRLNLFVASLALSSYFIQVQMWSTFNVGVRHRYRHRHPTWA
jgi:hypothetical protein